MKHAPSWHPGHIGVGYLIALFGTVFALFQWPFHPVLLGLLYGLLIVFFAFAMLVLGLTHLLIGGMIYKGLIRRLRVPSKAGPPVALGRLPVVNLLPPRWRWNPQRGPLWDRWIDDI